MNVMISDGDVCTDNLEVVNLKNAATDTMALNGFHVEYDVEIRGKSFKVIFQSDERSNGLEAYNGYEVRPGGVYGCEADQYDELETFIASIDEPTSEESNLLSDLKTRATQLSKAELEAQES